MLAACGGEPQDAPAPAAPSLSVSVTTPQQRDVATRISAAGSIAAWEEMALGVELSGQRVADVMVEVGDAVKAGDPLLKLDHRTPEMMLRQADATVAQARADLDMARSNARRGEQLAERKLIAAQDLDTLRATEQAAQAREQNARAARDHAKLQLDFSTLTAPHDGVISYRMVQPGQVVMAGTELLKLIRDSRLEWRAELPEKDLIRVAPGMTVDVLGPDGVRIEGRVRAVSPALDAASRTGIAYVDLPAPGALKAGMYASGEFAIGASPARTVPVDAIVERDGYRYVFVLGDDDRVRQQRVETGARDGDVVAVLSGIEDGQQVVVKGAGFLSDGDRVKVVEDTEKLVDRN